MKQLPELFWLPPSWSDYPDYSDFPEYSNHPDGSDYPNYSDYSILKIDSSDYLLANKITLFFPKLKL